MKPVATDTGFAHLCELIPAIYRLISRRIAVTDHGETLQCLECGKVNIDTAKIQHSSVCAVGEVYRLLLLISEDAAGQKSSPIPITKGAKPQEENHREKTGAGSAEELEPASPEIMFHEPWRIDEDGNVVNALGNIVVDPYGSTLMGAEGYYMRRIVACANICEGLQTDRIETIAITRVHDGPVTITSSKAGLQ